MFQSVHFTTGNPTGANRRPIKKEIGLQDFRGQGGGPKPRLSKDQKGHLKQILTDESDFWTYGEIRNLILNQFQITYSKR